MPYRKATVSPPFSEEVYIICLKYWHVFANRSILWSHSQKSLRAAWRIQTPLYPFFRQVLDMLAGQDFLNTCAGFLLESFHSQYHVPLWSFYCYCHSCSTDVETEFSSLLKELFGRLRLKWGTCSSHETRSSCSTVTTHLSGMQVVWLVSYSALQFLGANSDDLFHLFVVIHCCKIQSTQRQGRWQPL